MTSERRFESDLPVLLTGLAAERPPDYLDDAFFGQMADIRQRPAWAFPERWLPMDVATNVVGRPAFPWRRLAVLALIALLITAALAAYVGSQQRELPTPFGQAANGLIAFADGGDIYTVDPTSGTTSVVVAGPEAEQWPVWSRDGTRLAFARTVDGGNLLFVVAADGSELVQVTPEPLTYLDSWSFSPDGLSILANASIKGRAQAILAPTDGSGDLRVLDVPLPLDPGAVESPSFRPPDGAEVLVVGAGAGSRGLFVVDTASGAVRTIIEPDPSVGIYGASWSPDGSLIAYGRFDTPSDIITSRTHLISADGTGDVALDQHPDTVTDFPGSWSNDGTRLIITRAYGINGASQRIAIVPVDRSSVGVEIECPPTVAVEGCAMDWVWAPDDSVLLGTLVDDSDQAVTQLLADPVTGEARIAPWPATSGVDWQRVAPSR